MSKREKIAAALTAMERAEELIDAATNDAAFEAACDAHDAARAAFHAAVDALEEEINARN